jgi:hypothetical protein
MKPIIIYKVVIDKETGQLLPLNWLLPDDPHEVGPDNFDQWTDSPENIRFLCGGNRHLAYMQVKAMLCEEWERVHGKKSLAPQDVASQNGNISESLRILAGPVDTIVKHRMNGNRQSRPSGGTRGAITGLSEDSARRMSLYFRNTPGLVSLLTLTYPRDFPTDGKKVKRDLDVFRKWLRREFPMLGGCWFLEFQKRGAPHFHMFLNGYICGSYLRAAFGKLVFDEEGKPVWLTGKELVARRWFEIVGSGDLDHLKAGIRLEKVRKPHAAAVYAAKYSSKPEQKTVPVEYQNVGRFWGFMNLKPAFQVFDAPKSALHSIKRHCKRAYRAIRRSVGKQTRFLKGRYQSCGFTAWGLKGSLAILPYFLPSVLSDYYSEIADNLTSYAETVDENGTIWSLIPNYELIM